MSKKAKAILAAVLGVLAIVVILWLDTDLFASKPEPIKPSVTYTAEQQKQMEVEQKQRVEWEKKQKPPSGS
jgi:hypothetical protein